MSIEVNFCGIQLKNPLVLASGILGVTFSSLRRAYNSGAGLVTTKSVGIKQRKGHKAPVIFDYGFGLLNSVGLSNPGIENFIKAIDNEQINFPVIVSIFGEKEEDYNLLTEKLEPYDLPFIEINISCPNVEDEFGRPFSYSPELTYKIVKGVKNRTSKKIIVKLSPNTPEIIQVVEKAVNAGADAINVINTLGPGMVIDTNTGYPILSAGRGGMSGPAILPATVRIVFDVYQRFRIPIIGTGGVYDTRSAIQILMAGANLIGIGSAVYYKGIKVFKEIEDGLKKFVYNNRLNNITEIVGLSHHPRRKVYYRVEKSREDEPSKGILSGKPFNVCTVRKIIDHTPDIRSIFVENPGLNPEPGQFFMLWLPGVDMKPFSVMSSDDELIGFTIAKKGRYTSKLFKVVNGEPVGLLGPLGTGFDITKDRYLLAGGGIGIAPLLYAAHRIIERGRYAKLIACGKDKKSLEWVSTLLDDMSAESRLDIEYVTEDGSIGLKGFIMENIDTILGEDKYDFSLVCGPEPFMVKSMDLISKRGIDGQVSLERMMKCGIGICGSCTLDPDGLRVCSEGPVFKFKDVLGIKEFGNYRRDESGKVVEL